MDNIILEEENENQEMFGDDIFPFMNGIKRTPIENAEGKWLEAVALDNQKSSGSNRLGITPLDLKQAEEENQLLDSLIEDNDKQLNTFKESGINEQNKDYFAKFI